MVDVLGNPFNWRMARIGHSAGMLLWICRVVTIFSSFTAARASRKAGLIGLSSSLRMSVEPSHNYEGANSGGNVKLQQTRTCMR